MTIFSSESLLQLERDADFFRRQVLHVDERRQLAAERHLRDPFDESRLVHCVRDAGDVDRLAASCDRSLFPRGAQPHRSGSSPVDLLELLGRVQHLSAGWKVGTLDIAGQLNAAQIRVAEELHERRAHLAQVVRRDVGRHADGDAGCAVDEQIRNARREHHGFSPGPVIVRSEVHRRLIDFREQLVADPREAAFGVPHRGRAVAVERAEVAGAVDQRIPERKGLCHAHERLVERGVAVGVVVAHHVANHLGALPVLRVGGEVLLPHRVENAALHRLQAVTHIGERARGDDREGVIEIPGLRRFVKRDRLWPVRATAARVDDRLAVFVEQRSGFLSFGHVEVTKITESGKFTTETQRHGGNRGATATGSGWRAALARLVGRQIH